MTSCDQKPFSHSQNYLAKLQKQNKAYQIQKETLYRELSVQIQSLIGHLNQLGVMVDQKDCQFQNFKKQSGNWTKSTQKSKQDILKDSQIIIKQQPNQGYSDQSLKQKLNTLIQRQLQLKQKVVLFTQKNIQLQQKIQLFLQKKNQIKQRDQFIQKLQQTLQIQKSKYQNQLQAEINYNSKLQKTKLQYQYNKKITQFKEYYQQKTQYNIKKSEKIINILRQEKQKSITLLHEELLAMQKKYQDQNRVNNVKSPQKTRKFTLQYGGKIKSNTDQRCKVETEGKLKNANCKITDLQSINTKLQTQIENVKGQKLKLITEIQTLETNIVQKAKGILQKDNLISLKQKELNKITQQLKLKNQSCLKLQKTVKSLEAKIANLTEELRRSKKSTQEIRESTNRNARQLEKLLDDSKKELLQSKKSIFHLNSLFESAKNEIKQKEIRIQSMERQLQRTKSYNQILTKENISLNEIIENFGKRSASLQISTKLSLDDIKGQKDPRQGKVSQSLLIEHTKSMGNIYQIKTLSKSETNQKEDSKPDNLKLKQSDQNFSQGNERNLERNELILPLKQVQNIQNTSRLLQYNQRESYTFNYNSFETTFSPLISPRYPNQQRTQNIPIPISSNILNWNPQSPINEIQSLYNSSNYRNQQNHEMSPDQLIEKMSSLNRENKQTPNSPNSDQITDHAFNSPFSNQSNHKNQESLRIPKLRLLSRYTGQKNDQTYKHQSSLQDEERVLKLSFEGSNFYERSGFFNKRMNQSDSSNLRQENGKESLKKSN